MSRVIQLIVSDIDSLPTADGDDLARLQELFDEYFASPAAADHLDVWFRFYERFPDDHGHGVFWTILHGLESLPGYDAAVVASVRRKPTHYPVLMVNRMLNGDIASVNGVDLLGMLEGVASNESWPPEIRADAADFLDHQRNRR